MKKMLQKAAFLPFALALVVLPVTLTGCDNGSGGGKSGEKSIVSFKIDDAAGAILLDQISVVVPEGTDLSKLKPVVEVSHRKATVSPASEDEVDFTFPTTYVVIAENGTARTYVVTVRTAVTLSSISIMSNPYKTSYTKGTALDLTGLVVRGNYSDGSTKIETVTAANITNYDKDRLGNQYVIVTLDGKTVTFSVNVTEVTLSSISIMSYPIKTTYAKGTALDLTGLTVRGTYSDNSTKIETITAANISNYDKDIVGSQYVIVTLNEKMVTFNVTVTEVTLSSLSILSSPIKLTYVQGTELDLTGLTVRGYYSDGSYKIETITAANISNYDKDRLGSQTVYIMIDGRTTNFNVTVTAVYPLVLSVEFVNNGNDNLEIYGIPDGGIRLSVGKRNDLPDSIVISAGGYNFYSNQVQWYIDGSSISSNNIITINASQYTFTQPHTITIVATKDGVTHSKTITFTVEL